MQRQQTIFTETAADGIETGRKRMAKLVILDAHNAMVHIFKVSHLAEGRLEEIYDKVFETSK